VIDVLSEPFSSDKDHLTQIVNVQNVFGRTALFSAAEQNDAARAAALIQLGAEVSKRDKAGKNVLSVVPDKKSEVYKVLQAGFKAEQDKAKKLGEDLLFQSEPKQPAAQSSKTQATSQPKKSKPVQNHPKKSQEEITPSPAPATATQVESPVIAEKKVIQKEEIDSGPWQTVGSKKPKVFTPPPRQNQPKKTAPAPKQQKSEPIPSPVLSSPQKPQKSAGNQLNEMIRALEHLCPHAEDLDLHPSNLCGLGLESLSMAQLSALEEIHRQQLVVLGDAKVAEAKRQERIRFEEENKIEQEIQQLRRRV
jgi:hypothetical protein